MPSAVALLMLSVPVLSVVPPSKVPAPPSVSVPAPALVRLKELAPSVIAPPTVNVPPLTVTARLAPRVAVPVPRFRLFVPVKAKSAFQLWALLFERVIAPPLVLSIVPPAMVKVPVPSAVALLMLSVPALSVVPPLKVFAPETVHIPAPDLIKDVAPPLSPITAARVLAPALVPDKVRVLVPEPLKPMLPVLVRLRAPEPFASMPPALAPNPRVKSRFVLWAAPV